MIYATVLVSRACFEELRESFKVAGLTCLVAPYQDKIALDHSHHAMIEPRPETTAQTGHNDVTPAGLRGTDAELQMACDETPRRRIYRPIGDPRD